MLEHVGDWYTEIPFSLSAQHQSRTQVSKSDSCFTRRCLQTRWIFPVDQCSWKSFDFVLDKLSYISNIENWSTPQHLNSGARSIWKVGQKWVILQHFLSIIHRFQLLNWCHFLWFQTYRNSSYSYSDFTILSIFNSIFKCTKYLKW